jgi:hypothetical protein
MILLDSSVLIFLFEAKATQNNIFEINTSENGILQQVINALNKYGNKNFFITTYMLAETELVLRKRVVNKIIDFQVEKGMIKTEHQRQNPILKLRKSIEEYLGNTVLFHSIKTTKNSELLPKAIKLYVSSYRQNSLNDNLLIAEAMIDKMSIFSLDQNLRREAVSNGIHVIPG